MDERPPCNPDNMSAEAIIEAVSRKDNAQSELLDLVQKATTAAGAGAMATAGNTKDKVVVNARAGFANVMDAMGSKLTAAAQKAAAPAPAPPPPAPPPPAPPLPAPSSSAVAEGGKSRKKHSKRHRKKHTKRHRKKHTKKHRKKHSKSYKKLHKHRK